jgi:uncharacterized repeat protein (TIGR02543 family)
MPYIKDGDFTYTAVWEANTDTKYTIVYHKEKIGGNDKEFDTETEELTGTTDTTVTKTAPSAEGFTLRDDSTGEKSLNIDGSGGAYLEFYYLRDEYTVTWKPNGGTIDGSSANATTTVEYGDVITPPANVAKEGYTFKEWQDEDAQVLQTSTVKDVGDCTYTAQWKGAGGIKYTIEHYQQNVTDDGYTLADTVTDTGTTGDVITAGTNTYTGFTLSKDSAADDKKLTITADGKAVKKYYYDRNVYTVTFTLDGGTCNGSKDDVVYNWRYGASIVPPSGVTKEGYTFDIWTTNNNTPSIGATSSSRTVESDITFTPSWEGDVTSYKVIHRKQNADDDDYKVADTVTVTQNVRVGDSVTPDTKTYTGFASPEKQTFTATAAQKTITYDYKRLSYNLTTELDGGTLSSSTFTTLMSKRYGATITLPTASEVTKDGYTLDYWTFNDSTNITQPQPGTTVTMPNAPAYLTAHWSKVESSSSGSSSSSGGSSSGGTSVTASTDKLVLRKNADSTAYSVYVGETLADLKKTFEDAYWYTEDNDWDNNVRIDKAPQGYDIYAFKGDNQIFPKCSYFQVYVQNDVVVGMATISPYFTYQSSDGSTTYLKGKSATMGGSGWTSMNSTYRYQNAKYAKIGDAYVVAFVDTYDGNGKCVYGTQIFSSSFDVKDILLTSNIQKNGGYTDEVMEDMSLELEEWAKAYRYYRYADDTTYSGFATTKENESYIHTDMPLAKIHAQYQAANQTLQTNSFEAELKVLKNSPYSLTLSDNLMATRFAAGYLGAMKENTNSDIYDEFDKCLTSGELNGDGSPDALGFVTWWVDGGTENNSQYTTDLLVYKTTKVELDQSTLRMVGGAAYTSSGSQYTYATLDIFSIY